MSNFKKRFEENYKKNIQDPKFVKRVKIILTFFALILIVIASLLSSYVYDQYKKYKNKQEAQEIVNQMKADLTNSGLAPETLDDQLKAYRLDPTNPEVVVGLMSYHFWNGNEEEGWRYFHEAEKLNIQDPELINIMYTNVTNSVQDLNQKIENYKIILKYNPNDCSAIQTITSFYIRNKDYKGGEEYLDMYKNKDLCYKQNKDLIKQTTKGGSPSSNISEYYADKVMIYYYTAQKQKLKEAILEYGSIVNKDVNYEYKDTYLRRISQIGGIDKAEYDYILEDLGVN